MKRKFRQVDPRLTDADIARIVHILERMPIANKELSWLEALAPISNGKLLAKILYKLEEPDLKLMCRVSKTVNQVCKRYHLHERFYMGKVYMFGRGLYGALGDGDPDPHNVAIPKVVRTLPPVKSISCGYDHTGFVTVAGEVYMCGKGHDGRLGNGRIDNHTQPTPRKIENIPKVAAVACGIIHTMIMTVAGDVYTFGHGFNGMLGDGNPEHHTQSVPLKILNLPKAKAIACSFANSSFISENGTVYICGSGYYGQLGDGNPDVHSAAYFQIIPGIPPTKQLSCDSSHIGVVTLDGRVFMFGEGEHGRLGDEVMREHSIATPRQVEGLHRILSISCAFYHTSVVSRDGELFVFGKSTRGVVTRIESVPPIKAVSNSKYQTMAVSVANDVYILGKRYLEDPRPTSVFTKIDNLPPVQSVSCGRAHYGIVTAPESILNLTIDCHYCGKEAVYHDHSMAFCSVDCQRIQYTL